MALSNTWCEIADVNSLMFSSTWSRISALHLIEAQLEPGTLEYMFDRFLNLQSICISNINLLKEDWPLLLKKLRGLTSFSMYHVAYDSKLINEALIGSSITTLTITDCRYDWSTLDLTKTKIQSLIIENQIIVHKILKGILTVPLISLHLNHCRLTDEDGAFISSWLLWNNQLQMLSIKENQLLTDHSRRLIMKAIETHPRLRLCDVGTYGQWDSTVNDWMKERMKTNRSRRVVRVVSLLAQPPVPKDILRHIYLFLK